MMIRNIALRTAYFPYLSLLEARDTRFFDVNLAMAILTYI